ncbi:6-carboxyhexanoate--CoA ligase [Sporomusaceae bacterium BoRhaA]|uniref:6-carboxyhexanoate--CoA ligase n=1 Tax=Pelorhabdus rhamnosifermentans TaxID=2772457 RepID=UPI001C0622E4|nr:6-carboxyhexanoate--CoA ligase [Pelorhabdus rhamnosifermentans]MBU2703071.1 6-carboxyhexanoate--CoA ligase [Pelorhabdus rhamnosifermentans]
MLYSVKMRSAQGGAHEQGGRHISGAERMVPTESIEQVALSMIERAFHHSRGCADFINLKIEEVSEQNFVYVNQLPIDTVVTQDVPQGRKLAKETLIAAGVTEKAAQSGLDQLTNLTDSMRGAMLISAADGQRLDPFTQRGVRVSSMDIADSKHYESLLIQLGLTDVHVREAVVLASKVQSAPGVIAELCWSDDLNYTTGYVANHLGYFRFPHLKQPDSPVGGRAFFVEPDIDLEKLINYLENTPVLVVPQNFAEKEEPCKS